MAYCEQEPSADKLPGLIYEATRPFLQAMTSSPAIARMVFAAWAVANEIRERVIERRLMGAAAR